MRLFDGFFVRLQIFFNIFYFHCRKHGPLWAEEVEEQAKEGKEESWARKGHCPAGGGPQGAPQQVTEDEGWRRGRRWLRPEGRAPTRSGHYPFYSSLLFHGEKVIDFPGRRLFSSVPFSSTLVSVSGSEGPSKRLNTAFKDASEVRCKVQGLCQGQFIECELVA